MAADSLVTENNGLKQTRTKLDQLTSHPIAWGFTGDEGVGFQFRDWLKAQVWPETTSWRGIVESAVEELSRLNGRQRRLNKLAGVETKEDDLANVLIAGYVGGVPEVFELTDRGSVTSVKSNVFAAIGSGHPHATIAFTTLRSAKKDVKLDSDLMRFVVEIASQLAPMCGLPVRILRIAPTGVEDLTVKRP